MSHQESDPVDMLMETIYRLKMELVLSKKLENQNNKIIENLKQENYELKHVNNSQESLIYALQAKNERLTAQNNQLQAQNNALQAT